VRVGPVDESLRLTGDWKFWASILHLADLVFVAQPLNYFRTHPATTRAVARNWTVVRETFCVMRDILANGDVPLGAIETLHARVAVLMLHALVTERPTRADLSSCVQFMSDVHFGFSTRAARSFGRQILQASMRRLKRIPQQRFRT
jgi:hypothetical protein